MNKAPRVDALALLYHRVWVWVWTWVWTAGVSDSVWGRGKLRYGHQFSGGSGWEPQREQFVMETRLAPALGRAEQGAGTAALGELDALRVEAWLSSPYLCVLTPGQGTAQLFGT